MHLPFILTTLKVCEGESGMNQFGYLPQFVQFILNYCLVDYPEPACAWFYWHKFFSKSNMENNEKILQEQEAPLKNHDDAFVQVGKNGEPVIPENSNEKEAQPREADRTTTLDKR